MAERAFGLAAADLRRVIVTSTHYKPEAEGPSRHLAEMLQQLGCEVILDVAGTLPLAQLEPADVILAVGGDGTILNTARRLVGRSTPVIGVNLGKLGFLADHGISEVEAWLAGGSSAGWHVAQRMMLQLDVAGSTRYALNDVIVSQGVMTRLISIDVHVDGAHATQYRADGLVVSTPTGSTAYSLSLGGPILWQGQISMVITPIAPHSLTDRPIVLDGRSELRFELLSSSDEMALVVDGQERVDVRRGDSFTIRQAPTGLNLVLTGERDWFAVLRQKLGWGAQHSRKGT